MAEKQKDLTGKQKRFCEEYIYDWNGTRAAKVAGYSPETAGAIASENLTKPEIQAYLKQLLDNLEQTAGISKLMVLTEHKKILHTSIAHLHETWITRKEFDQLTDDQKSSIAEIGTRIKKFTEYQGDTPVPVEVEEIKIKLYDRQKSLDAIAKLMGYEAVKKMQVSLPEKQTFEIGGQKIEF